MEYNLSMLSVPKSPATMSCQRQWPAGRLGLRVRLEVHINALMVFMSEAP